MSLNYIELNGKFSGVKKADRKYYNKPDESWYSYGAKYPEGYLKVDIDDYNHKTGELVEPIHGKPRSKAIIAMLNDDNIKYRGVRTQNGVHLFMKAPENMPHKTKATSMSAVNVPMEYKFPESDDHMRLKFNGHMLETFGVDSLEKTDTLPKWLEPIQKTREKPFSMYFPEGDRTQLLGGYLFYLVQRKEFTADEAFKTVELMNKFTFENPIPESTLNAEILNEATYSKLSEEYQKKDERRNKKFDSLDTFKDFLDQTGIKPRYNSMLNRMEWNNIPPDYDTLTDIENNMPVKIQDEYQKYIGHKSSLQTVKHYIQYYGDVYIHNPVKEYLTSETWDGTDRFPKLFQIMGIDDAFQETLVRKFFYQAAAMPFNTLEDPFQAEGVLILQGAEGIGKSRFFELVSPDPLWKRSFYQDFDTNKKDKLIEVTSGFIVELAEIDRTFRSNKSDIKGFFTSPTDNIRKPYAPEAVLVPRMNVYCGTTNALSCLTKDSGYRRWWTIPVTHIDLETLESITPEEKKQFWGQCYYVWKNDKNCFRLSSVEQTQLKTVNLSYMELSPEAETLFSRFDFDAPKDTWNWKTSTEIVNTPSYRVVHDTPQAIGTAMTTILEIDSRVKRKISHKVKKYFIPPAVKDPYDEDLTKEVGKFLSRNKH